MQEEDKRAEMEAAKQAEEKKDSLEVSEDEMSLSSLLYCLRVIIPSMCKAKDTRRRVPGDSGSSTTTKEAEGSSITIWFTLSDDWL